MKRAVITGMGPVSAIGIGREAFADAVRARRPGMGPATAAGAAGRPAGEIRAFSVADYLESPKNYLDRSSELAFAALSLALEDANLDPKACGSAALLLGSAYGNLATMSLFFADFVQKGPRLVKPVLFPHTYSNTTISLLAMEYNLSGTHANYAAGAVSSACALAEGFDLIRQGRESLVLAGGFDSLNGVLLAGLADAGFVPGEGAGILVLEERERALARGAAIRGEILGVGMAGGHRPDEAMAGACRQAGWEAGSVGLLVAHGPAAAPAGAAVLDLEALAGETLGAGGALRVMAALGAGRGAAARRMLANSTDPGGQSVSVALQGAET